MSIIRLVLLGAPGVGKGSFAKKIGPKFDLPIISTGDLVRQEIKSGSALGLKIKSLNDQGKLVDDETIINMAKNRILAPDTKGFILDGFPRTVPQAEMLWKISFLDAVINLELPQNILIEKAVARRTCQDCGEGYNLADIRIGSIEMPPLLPKKEGTCDKCGGKLVQRDDDTKAIVENRLKVYNKQTAPLIEFYKAKGSLIEFPITKGMGDLPRLDEIVKKLDETAAAKRKQPPAM